MESECKVRMKSSYLSRKDEIIMSTISLIQELGIHNVSMKDISRREGVTEASLYKHFKNKEEILDSVLEYYEKYDDYIYSTLKDHTDAPGENILQFFTIYAEYYGNYKEITALFGSNSVLLYQKSFAPRIKDKIMKQVYFLTGLIEHAQTQGELSTNISAEDFAYILLGTFHQIIEIWRLQDYSFLLKDKTDATINNIVRQYEEKRR